MTQSLTNLMEPSMKLIHNRTVTIYSDIQEKRNVLTAISHHRLVCLSKHLSIQKSITFFSSCVTRFVIADQKTNLLET